MGSTFAFSTGYGSRIKSYEEGSPGVFIRNDVDDPYELKLHPDWNPSTRVDGLAAMYYVTNPANNLISIYTAVKINDIIYDDIASSSPKLLYIHGTSGVSNHILEGDVYTPLFSVYDSKEAAIEALGGHGSSEDQGNHHKKQIPVEWVNPSGNTLSTTFVIDIIANTEYHDDNN